MPSLLRVLVVDDSITYRKIVRDALAQNPDVEVVGHASSGSEAIDSIRAHRPDMITLDFEMPGGNGLTVLEAIRRENLPTKAIMLSSMTSTGARQTTQALAAGAFDFILKPSGSTLSENVNTLCSEFAPRIRALRSEFGGWDAGHTTRQTVSTGASSLGADSRFGSGAVGTATATASRFGERESHSNYEAPYVPVCGVPKVVVLGISTGGPAALNAMLPKLPGNLSVPMLIVQHMPPMFTKSLADDLNRNCALNVAEASGGERLAPGHCYIAPGGKQMKITDLDNGPIVRVTDDAAENSCKPAVDYLFRSAEEVYGGNVLGRDHDRYGGRWISQRPRAS